MRNSAHCETSPLSTSRDYLSACAHENGHGGPVTTALEKGQTEAVSKHKARKMKGEERFGAQRNASS